MKTWKVAYMRNHRCRKSFVKIVKAPNMTKALMRFFQLLREDDQGEIPSLLDIRSIAGGEV